MSREITKCRRRAVRRNVILLLITADVTHVPLQIVLICPLFCSSEQNKVQPAKVLSGNTQKSNLCCVVMQLKWVLALHVE